MCMTRKLLKRLIVGICTALIFSSAAIVVSAAGPPKQAGPVRTDCNECHDSVVDHLEDSAHGHALDNPVFQEAWQEKGQDTECLPCHTTGYDPATNSAEYEGVACTVCHTPVNDNHPLEVMPTRRQCQSSE